MRSRSENSHRWLAESKPGTGKTVLSGKVITYLRYMQKQCSFYFFRTGDKGRSNIASFLLSMARQMAFLNEDFKRTILEIYKKDDKLSKADYRTIWRKLFLEGILKIKGGKTQYWVIDALDECTNEPDIVHLLMKVAEVSSACIFLTSRNPFESRRRLGLPKVQVAAEQIQEVDSKSDIALYLEANMDELPSVYERGRQHIVHQILSKSSGCFLVGEPSLSRVERCPHLYRCAKSPG